MLPVQKLGRTTQHVFVIWRNALLSRTFSVGGSQFAGFQGVKGTTGAEILQRKIEKTKKLIHKLENMALEIKPIKDFNIRYSWKTPERQRRIQPLTAEELEDRILLQKQWNAFVSNRKVEEDNQLHLLKRSQENALFELRKESEDLYQAAIEVDDNLFPFSLEGPSETPPIKKYLAPLGSMVHWEESMD